MNPALVTLLDRYTNEVFTFSPTVYNASGGPMTDADVDNVIYCKGFNGIYYKREFTGSASIRWFGAVSDGDENTLSGTDNRDFIIEAINTCSNTKKHLLIDGKFSSSQLHIITTNLTIDFTKDSYLLARQDMGAVDRLFWIDQSKNVTINGNGARFKAPVFTEGEFRHLCYISDSKDIQIERIEGIGGGGDAFSIIAFDTVGNTDVENIKLIKCIANSSRRNGLSIANGVNIIIEDFLAKNVLGTPPAAGIDIEPNPNINFSPSLKGIRIINPTTTGCGGHGIDVALGNFSHLQEMETDIIIENHTSINDGVDYAGTPAAGFRLAGNGYTGTWVNKVRGSIHYSGKIYNPAGNGININSWHLNNSPRGYIQATIFNVGYLGTTNNAQRSGVNIFNGAGSSFEVGNVELNVDVFDTRSTINTYTAVYFQNSNFPIKNTKALINTDDNTISGTGIIQILTIVNETEVTYKNNKYIESESVMGASSVAAASGCTVNMNGGSSFNLPLSTNLVGQFVRVNNTTTAPVNITPMSGDKILANYSNQGAAIILSYPSEYVKLRATREGWIVEETNSKGRILFTGGNPPRDVFWSSSAPIDGTWVRGDKVYNSGASGSSNLGWVCITGGSPGVWQQFSQIGNDLDKVKSGTTVSRPTVSTIGFQYFDTTIGKPVWWNGTSWVESEPVATTSAAGILKVTAAQADSTATDVAGLVADFNAFLAKQRASGQMEN